MKRTRWFPVSVKPVRAGWFEYRGEGISKGQRRHWSGRRWHWIKGSQYPVPPFPSDHWRGLTEKAK